MDRIQKALEKATRERNDTQGIHRSETIDAGDPSSTEDTLPKATLDFANVRKVSRDDEALFENRVIVADHEDGRAEVYRHLRTQILPTLRANNWHILGITSSNHNEGKTLTAINLALSMAQEYQQPVLLVDLDIRQPSIDTVLGLDVKLGISDYLRGDCNLQDVLVDPGLGNITLLPGKPFERRHDELLSRPTMKEFLRVVSKPEDGRIVIVDLPPLLSHNDALMFLPNLDAVLLVVEEGRSTADAVQKSIKLLEGSNVLGTVLNKSHYA